MELNNALIIGAIYDPDTNCQYVLMRVSSKDWDKYQQELEGANLPESIDIHKIKKVKKPKPSSSTGGKG